MASDRYSRLLKNSLVFFIGNLGSKIISFVIVPFYTYVLTTEEYGSADLITTTVNMLAPFVMVGMNEAVLRFSASKEDDIEGIATNSLAVVAVGSAISWLLFPLFARVSVIGDNVALFLPLLTLTCFNNVFLQLLRGTGRSRSFASNGVLVTFTMAAANVVALAAFHFGVKGYLASMLVAQAVGAIHIIISCRLWRLISLRAMNRQLVKRMLVYCVPLIPNSLMWWIMSASDRYVILFFLGAGANGIYNVSQKIPSIVNIVYSVFMQAWQISAIEERNSEDNARFQSTVFRYMFIVLALASSLIAASSYPVYTFLMDSSYVGSWQPVALLSLANLFSCIAAFFGTTYVVTKQSKKAFSTTVIGAAANIVLTLALVPLLGIMGAAVATAASYVLIAVARYRDTCKMVKLTFNKREMIPSFFIITIQVGISFFPYSLSMLVADFVLLAALLVVLRRGLVDIAKIGRNFTGARGKSR